MILFKNYNLDLREYKINIYTQNSELKVGYKFLFIANLTLRMRIISHTPSENCKFYPRLVSKILHTCGNSWQETRKSETERKWSGTFEAARKWSAVVNRRWKSEPFWSVESSGDKQRLFPEPHQLYPSAARSCLPFPIQRSLSVIRSRTLSFVLLPPSSSSSYSYSTLLQNTWISKQSEKKKKKKKKKKKRWSGQQSEHWPCESGAREEGDRRLEASTVFGWWKSSSDCDCDCDWRSWMKDLSSSFRYSKRLGWRSWRDSSSAFAWSSIILFLASLHSKSVILSLYFSFSL